VVEEVMMLIFGGASPAEMCSGMILAKVQFSVMVTVFLFSLRLGNLCVNTSSSICIINGPLLLSDN